MSGTTQHSFIDMKQKSKEKINNNDDLISLGKEYAGSMTSRYIISGFNQWIIDK